MFARQNVHGVLRGLAVRSKDEREKDSNHLIELKFEVPLDHDLAEEIQPVMARDLFDKTKDGYVPKPELAEVGFELNPGMQVFSAREVEEQDPFVRVAGVQIRKIKVRKDGGAWFLSFLAGWVITDTAQGAPFLMLMTKPILLTFELQNPQLAGMEPEAEAPKRKRRQKALPAPAADEPVDDTDAATGEELSL